MADLTPKQREIYNSLRDGNGTAERYKQLILAGKIAEANAWAASHKTSSAPSSGSTPPPSTSQPESDGNPQPSAGDNEDRVLTPEQRKVYESLKPFKGAAHYKELIASGDVQGAEMWARRFDQSAEAQSTLAASRDSSGTIEDQIARKQARIQFLLDKGDPNDPEVAMIRGQIQELQNGIGAPPTGGDAAPGGTPDPGTGGGTTLGTDVATGIVTESGKAPGTGTTAPAPDPTKTDYKDPGSVAGTQEQENSYVFDKNLLANRPNETTAQGSKVWTVNPDTGQLELNVELSQPEQKLYDSETNMSSLAKDVAAGFLRDVPYKAYDPNSVNDKYGIPTGDEAQRLRIEDSTYARLTRDLSQQEKDAREELRQNLADRGIPYDMDPNSTYGKAMKSLNQRFDDARLSARQQATQMGGDELARTYGMGLQSHQTALGDYQSQYTLPTDVAAKLAGVGRSYQSPTFQAPFQAVEQQAVDYAGIANSFAQIGLSEEQINNQAEQWAQQFGIDKETARAQIKKIEADIKAQRQLTPAQVAALNRQNTGGGRSGGGGGSGSAPGADF